MTGPAPLGGAGDVAASHHAVLSRSQAAANGLSARTLARLVRAGVLIPASSAAFSFVGSPMTWHQRLAVAVASAPGVVVSHRAAAGLHRLDGLDGCAVEVTVRRGGRVRVPGVVVHQVGTPLGVEDVLDVDGLPTTTLARTIVDLGAVVTSAQLERACDDFERRGFSLAWLEQTALRLHRPGQRGTNAVLAHIAVRRAGGRVRGSWFEQLIEECIRSPRLPPLERQHVLRDASGAFVAAFDLAFPAVRLAIEAHSRGFHTGEHNEVVDQRRDNRASLLGWDIRYLGWADRKTPAQARRFIEQLIARRCADIGIPAKWGQDRPL